MASFGRSTAAVVGCHEVATAIVKRVASSDERHPITVLFALIPSRAESDTDTEPDTESDKIGYGIMAQPDFIAGLELCEGFFFEHVQPILARGFPQLRHSAGLNRIWLGKALGFDTPMSAGPPPGPARDVVSPARGAGAVGGIDG